MNCRQLYYLLTPILVLIQTPGFCQQFNYNFDSLKHVIDTRPADQKSIRAYVDYAAKFFYVRSDSGLYYIERAIALSRKKNDAYMLLFSLKNKGDYFSISGQFKQAVATYRYALSLPPAPETWLVGIKIKGNLGSAYTSMGMLDSSRILHGEVAEAFNKHTNDRQDSIAMAFSYLQLFDLYQIQGLMNEAIYYGEKGYELSLPLKVDRGIGYGLYIKALKYASADPARALDHCKKSLQIATGKNIPELEVFVRNLKAKIFISLKKYKEAEAELLLADKFTAGSVRQATYANLAGVYYYLGDLPKGLSYFRQSYALAEQTGYRGPLINALKNGILIYERLKDYKTAYVLQKRYQALQQEIASENMKLDYQRSALKFRTAEKEKQLAETQLLIVQKDNRLDKQSFLIVAATVIALLIAFLWALHHRHQKKLKQQQASALETSLELQTLEAMLKGEETERNRIAKDLHDGIGGLLSAVKMRFSTVQNEYPELKNSASFYQAISILDDATAEVRKTAHNLMPDILQRFGLNESLQVFCNNLSIRKQLQVDYQSIGEIGRFDSTFELGIYRIIQELLNNIVRHSGAAHALVQVSRQDELLTVSVEDDGKGFSIQDTEAGMGLRSIKDRVRSLKGLLEIDSSPGKGTAVYMEFEISKVIRQLPEPNEN